MHTQHPWKAALAGAAAMLFGAGVGLIGPHLAAQGPAPQPRSVWDGVYTDAQAVRGEAVYARYCEQCHLSDLGGDTNDEIPALAWDPFMLRWGGKSVQALVDAIARAMPIDAPASLTPRQYADVVAYILKVNKFPAGARDLERESDAGRAIIEKNRSDPK